MTPRLTRFWLAVVILSSAVWANAASFTAKPEAKRKGDRTEIVFSVSAQTDVEVAVLAGSNVVRHLAAGLLGPNAPAPFQKNSLSQAIAWDGNDDAGKPVTGPCQARVSIGAKPRLDKIVGRYDSDIYGNIVGVVVGPNGEIYMTTSESYRGGTATVVLDKDGKYLRTIIPYPANTPKERLASVGQLEIAGERLPVVLNAVARTTMPLLNGMRVQNMAFNPKGYLAMVSAIGTMSEQGTPRHLLALHPEGGAPEGVEFVGPQLRKPGSFMGGSGEGPVGVFDHVAVSPDGAWVYVSVSAKSRFGGARHGIWRLKWDDKEAGVLFLGQNQPGSDDTHFNNPEGLAVDGKGNLYVCDWGNNRVVIFSVDGKRLGQFAADKPQQIAVHPKTGQIYVLSRDAKTSWANLFEWNVVIRKLAPWSGEAPAELARLDGKGINLMALDCSAAQPKLWVSGNDLFPVVENGNKLTLGTPVTTHTGVVCPWFIAADAARNRVFVYERGNQDRPTIFSVDLNTGVRKAFGAGVDPVVDQDGNLYVYNGYDIIERFDPAGKPLPSSVTGSNKLKTKGSRGYGPNLGMPGYAVGANGDIYVSRTSNNGGPGSYGGRVDVYTTDGKLKTENLIDGLGYGDCGVGVDAAGDVYVGSNVKLASQPVPNEFVGQVPTKGWTWWSGPERAAPWRYPHLDSYLFYWGSVFKFGPSGGVFYGQHPWLKADPKFAGVTTFSSSNAPAGSVSYRSAYLDYEIRVKGALWQAFGMGPIPSSGDGLQPDPGCICHNSRMAVDPYGRVFMPDVFRFAVDVLDGNGNALFRIGRYGNADSAGAASRIPSPEIAFAWPAFVSQSQGKIFVSDPANRRITVIGFDHAAEAVCEIR